MTQEDIQRDRQSIPSSSMSEQEDLRNQRYDRESNAQDLSDADDLARDREDRAGRDSSPADEKRDIGAPGGGQRSQGRG